MRIATTLTSIGTMPPVQNITCQPYVPINIEATRPPSAPPSATPTKLNMVMLARIRRGANSVFNATVMGNTPPMPMPAMKRNAIIEPSEFAQTCANVNKPKKKAPRITANFRPNRSAR